MTFTVCIYKYNSVIAASFHVEAPVYTFPWAQSSKTADRNNEHEACVYLLYIYKTKQEFSSLIMFFEPDRVYDRQINSSHT